MKKKLLIILGIIEFLILIGIIILLSLRISEGLYVNEVYQDIKEILFACLKISSTFLYLIFGLYFYIRLNKKRIIGKYAIFILYFLIIFLADIFFSLYRSSIAGMISFLIAYSLIMIFLYKHYIEIIIRVSIFIIGIIILFIIHKFTFESFVVVTLVEILVFNMILSWIRYIKSKNKDDLCIALGVTLAFISDFFIGIRSIILDPKAINDISSYIIWITYMLANYMFICFIRDKKNKNE